jgi:hypothetical protein
MYLFVYVQWEFNYDMVIGKLGIVGRGKKEKAEVGPVVVPKGWDCAAASMRKGEGGEDGKLRSWEVGKLGS